MRALIFCFVLAGCNGAPPEPAAGCNPLVGDECLSPFPSSFYEQADSTSATGVRVALDSSTLPVSNGGTPMRVDRMNTRDGFSPSTQFLVYFKTPITATLPGPDSPEPSLTPTGPVQILDFDTGERVPAFGELDVNALQGDRQGIVIHALVRLIPSHRYIIAMVDVGDAPAPFRALRDKGALNQALTRIQPRAEEVFAKLTAAGVDRSKLTLAWDVQIASDETATSHLLAMRDNALSMSSTLGYHITSSTDMPNDTHLLREVLGTVDVPMYLIDDSNRSGLVLDDAGMPKQRTIGTATMVVHIPKCASTASGPLPVMIFGHGLFGSAAGEMGSDYQKQVIDTLCMVQVGTDWLGLDKDDVALVSAKVIPDLNNLSLLTDRLQQAHLNAQMMTHTFLTKVKDDPSLQVNGHAVTDGSQVYYYGISDGGIQGGTFMALSPDVQRGVLNVPGCEWSLLMFRSHDFQSLKLLLNSIYPDPFDQQVLITLSQSEWDYTDPATFAPHLLKAPLPGAHPDKRVILQESIGDSQVPNIATRVMARTIGLDGNDLEQPVFGITQKAAPLDSAYTQWNVNSMPLPPVGNEPPPQENQAHEGIRRLDALVMQVKLFFTPTGQVQQTCQGICSFPVPPGTPAAK